MTKLFKPGQKAKTSGQFGIVGTKREITVSKGEIFPPSGALKHPRYKLVDATKHK